MSETSEAVAELPGGPYDVEFFFDPLCPFAWQASVWIRRVAELRGVKVGWRFISLRFVNEDADLPEEMAEAQIRGLRYHRVCAAARERLGNAVVGALYRAWGERYWYADGEGEIGDRLAVAARRADPAEIVASLGLPSDLLDAADDPSWDAVIRAETDEAFRRTRTGRRNADHHLQPTPGELAVRPRDERGPRRRPGRRLLRRAPHRRRLPWFLGDEAHGPGPARPTPSGQLTGRRQYPVHRP